MTYLEVAYRYQTPPGEAELRAIDSVREVYGIQCIEFNEKERTVRVLFDASRLKGDSVAKLLRQAGIDVQDQLVGAWHSWMGIFREERIEQHSARFPS